MSGLRDGAGELRGARLLLRPESPSAPNSAGQPATADALDWKIAERATGRKIGAVALQPAADGWVTGTIEPAARGHGYAVEAVQLVAGFGFDRGLARLQIRCGLDELAAAKTALAAGFRFEGVARGISLDGSGAPPVRDEAIFSRLAGDPSEPVPPAFGPLPPGGLHDGVLALRPVRADDAAAMLAAEDAEATRWNFTGRPPTPEETATRAARAGLEWLVGPHARLAMIELASGSYAGDVMLRLVGPPQIAGIGYTVHPAFRGRGFTTRALRLLSPWAFDAAGFARLELGAKVGNVASQRAALSAGYEADGIRRARLRNGDGTFSDEARFALVNPRLPS